MGFSLINNSLRTFAPLFFACALLASACGRARTSDLEETKPYRIATGSPGGTYNQIGIDLNRLLAHLDGTPIRFAPMATTGSRENLDLLASGGADIALVTEDALDANREKLMMSSGPQSKAEPQTLGVLYVGAAQFVLRKSLVRSGTMDDLADVDLYPGAEGSGTERSTLAILGALNIRPTLVPTEERTLGYSESAAALREGKFDAVVLSGGPPVAALANLLEDAPGEFVILAWSAAHIDRAIEANPGLVPSEIPAGTYSGQDVAIPSVGKRTLLVARGDLPPEEVNYIKLAVDVSFMVLESDPISDKLHPILSNLTPQYWESTFR